MLNTTINTNEISRFFKFELLDETIQFHEKLDKFDSMLESIMLPFDAELSPVNQQLFDITYHFLTEYHYKL